MSTGLPTPRALRTAALLLAAVAGLACAGAPGPGLETDAAPLRVMTFNIRYGTAPDGENAWLRRRALLLDVIADHDPAVLGVQEAVRFQLDEIRRAMPRQDMLKAQASDRFRRDSFFAPSSIRMKTDRQIVPRSRDVDDAAYLQELFGSPVGVVDTGRESRQKSRFVGIPERHCRPRRRSWRHHVRPPPCRCCRSPPLRSE